MRQRKPAIGFIFVTMLIDVIGFGLIIPVIPRLISEMEHVPMNAVSTDGGWLLFSYSLMQFLMGPVIGNLSDQYGRRPVLLLSLFGFGIDYLVLAFAPTYAWLFVGRIIAGITGASFTTAAAYIADISTAENRAKNFGMIGAAFGLGFILGPAIGGLLSGWGLRAPFYVAAGITLLNWLYGFFLLPESLSPEHRRPFDWRRANPFGALKQISHYPAIAGLIASLTLVYLASHAVQSNWTFFTMYRFNWTPKTVGLSLAVVGALVGLVQVLLTPIVSKKIGNERSIYIGLLFYALGMFLFAFASQSWMMFLFLVPYCLGGIAGPALQALMTGQVPPNAQGELQGILTSMMSLMSIAGPLLMTYLFRYFTSKGSVAYFPGAPFLLGGLLFTASAGLAYKTLHKS